MMSIIIKGLHIRAKLCKGGPKMGHVENKLYGNGKLHLDEERRCTERENCMRCTKSSCIERKNCTVKNTYMRGELQ